MLLHSCNLALISIQMAFNFHILCSDHSNTFSTMQRTDVRDHHESEALRRTDVRR